MMIFIACHTYYNFGASGDDIKSVSRDCGTGDCSIENYDDQQSRRSRLAGA